MTQETMGMAGGVRSPVLILSVAQALYLSTLLVIFTSSGLVGVAPAPMASLATLPLALSTVITAATTIPASILMARFGRPRGLQLGAFIGPLAAGLGACRASERHFASFFSSLAPAGVFSRSAMFFSTPSPHP